MACRASLAIERPIVLYRDPSSFLLRPSEFLLRVFPQFHGNSNCIFLRSIRLGREPIEKKN
jgi:hypothetical protein